MSCKSCLSDKQQFLTGEIAIHFPGCPKCDYLTGAIPVRLPLPRLRPLLTNSLPPRTAATAGKSSVTASDLRTHPCPMHNAAFTTSSSFIAVKKSIVVLGTTWRIRFAASIPCGFGRPMSSTTRSGFNVWAFLTASKPSAASPTTCNSGRAPSIEQTDRRHGSKSSTTRMQIDRCAICE